MTEDYPRLDYLHELSSDHPQVTSRALNSVIVDLQQSLREKLCFAADKLPSYTRLHSFLNGVFQSSLRSRCHLLVVDDAFDPLILQQMCFEQMRGVVLVTAREPMCRELPAHTLYINPTEDTREAAQRLLEACAGRAIDRMDVLRRVSC